MTSTALAITPEDTLADLVGQIRHAMENKQHTKVFQLRQKVKTHCATHGLPTPPEAIATRGRTPAAPATTILPMATVREAQPLKVQAKGPQTTLRVPPPAPAPQEDDDDPEERLRGPRAKARSLRIETEKLVEAVKEMPQMELTAMVEDLRWIALHAQTALSALKIRLGRP